MPWSCFTSSLLTFPRRSWQSDHNTKLLTFRVFSWKTLNATRDGRISLPSPSSGAAWSSVQMKCWGMCLCNLLNRISRPVPTFSAHSGRLTATSELTAMIFNAYAACCSDKKKKKNVKFYLRANFSSQKSLNSVACVLWVFLSLILCRAVRILTEGRTVPHTCFQAGTFLFLAPTESEKNQTDLYLLTNNILIIKVIGSLSWRLRHTLCPLYFQQ